MFVFAYCVLAVQVNRLFPLKDVLHLVRPRLPRYYRIEYGNFKEYDAMVVSSKAPEHTIVSLESNRLHVFLHDHTCIRRCVWDGDVSFDDKKDIVRNMMTWWAGANHTQFTHKLVSYEDGVVFTDITRELEHSDD